MLLFLFKDEELGKIFRRLGYGYGTDTARRNLAYYDRRTSHGSTLSFVTHAGALAAIDPESSWDRFLVALDSDAGDIQGGTTKEGIHLGVMAGTLDLMQRSYAGTYIHDDVLCFDPRLPSRLNDLSFSMQFRETPIRGREPFGQGRGGRRCPRAERGRPDRIRADRERGGHRALRRGFGGVTCPP
jgi:trehalose/maltose hydrolase-like predicted phosphorylase